MKSTIVHFDSRDRFEYADTTSSDYVLPMPVILHEVVKARLISVELPSSFYVFRQVYGNTSIRVTVYDTVSGTQTATVTLPDGNYNASTISAALQSALDTQFAPLTFTVALSQSTLKTQIENVDGYEVEVHTGDAENHIEYAKTLPFFLGYQYDSTTKGSPCVSQNVASINPFTYAMLDVRELGSGSYEGGMYGSRYSPSTAVFAKIPINNNSFEYTFWEPQTMAVVDLNPVVSRLDRLSVTWRFHDMTLIDFHNMDHSFTIEFVTKDGQDTRLDTLTNQVQFIANHLSKSGTPHAKRFSESVDAIPVENKEAVVTHLVPKPLLIFLCLASIAGITWYMTRRPER